VTANGVGTLVQDPRGCGAAMFVEITNEPRDYAWGSTTLIPELRGLAPNGKPQAELWLGTHPGSPARIVGREGDLREIAGDLPFLLKILAAGAPLSLQVHPDPEQARAGFARENAAGIPVDAPHRNYKDPSAKPEMIYALSDEFRALCGFRAVAETRAVLDDAQPGLFADLRTDADIRPLFEWLLSGHPDVVAIVADITSVAADAEGESWATVRRLAEHFPGDPGIAISLLLNTVVLRRGEALYLPAGNIHAYLSGLGIELMGPSDNVLRCGLTPKHVDVPELLSVVDFMPTSGGRLVAATPAPGLREFRPEGAGFRLVVLESSTHSIDLAGRAAVVVALGGGAVVDGIALARGGAAVITAQQATTIETGDLVALAVSSPADA
jgi:mannose-6-phosphate isomerase